MFNLTRWLTIVNNQRNSIKSMRVLRNVYSVIQNGYDKNSHSMRARTILLGRRSLFPAESLENKALVSSGLLNNNDSSLKNNI